MGKRTDHHSGTGIAEPQGDPHGAAALQGRSWREKARLALRACAELHEFGDAALPLRPRREAGVWSTGSRTSMQLLVHLRAFRALVGVENPAGTESLRSDRFLQ